MLQTRQLQFQYSADTHFHFPDISCASGKTLLVTGSSGVGKTTFLHLLAGILSPTSGQVFVGDTDMTQLPEKKRDQFRGQHIGIVFQQAHFVASLSVLENLTLASWLATGEKQTARAEQLLATLGLQEHRHKNTARLSTGQQQRVAIARALMNRPQLLLADEPTSSLDDNNSTLVAQLLQEQAAQSGAALIIVTHDHRLKNLFTQTQSLV